MVLANHIKSAFAVLSKAGITDTIMGQVVNLTEKLFLANKEIAQISGELSLSKEENAQLRDENTALKQRVSDLERSANLNSRNSSKPPSSDGLKKPSVKENKRTRSQRDTSKRKPGGQPGHKGTTLKQVKNPDVVTDHFPHQCHTCNATLSQESKKFAARQVFDLPPPPPMIVTEHRAHTCQFPHCGEKTRAVFLKDVKAPTQYGRGFAVIAANFQTYLCVPEKRMSKMFLDVFKIRISSATIARKIAQKATEMNPFTEAVKDTLSGNQTSVKHMDETGLRVEGKTRWVHVLCSTLMSYLRLGASRGDVPKNLLGIAVHDFFSSNWTLEDIDDHGVCNAHTLRNLVALSEIEKEPWAFDMVHILLDGMDLADTARNEGRSAVEPEAIKEVEDRYDACCNQGIAYHENQPPLTLLSEQKRPGRQKKRIGHNNVSRLKDFKKHYLLFLHDLTVPFTNNEAERDLRMTKVRQKISGCFRNIAGAVNFCILRTVIETGRKQNWDIMETLNTPPDQLIKKLRAS